MTGMNIVTRQSKSGRKLRNPEFPFYVRGVPMVLNPMHISPVLPGETLTSLLWQFRAITQPLRSQVCGWWAEVYFFYVKLSQLDSATSFIGAQGDDLPAGMVLNPTYNAAALADAASTNEYHEDTASINYVKRCRDVVVREYFRDEGEDETTATGLYSGLAAAPMVHAKLPGWMDSIIGTGGIPTAPGLPNDAASATMRELERLQQQWEMMNALGITGMTYEDFVKASFGVNLPTDANNSRPELLRYERYWQLPGTAALGGTSDAPTISSVCSWKAEGRGDKDRLFKEHGFICGYIVFRPKVYLSTQRTAAVSMLDNAFAWAPRMFDDQYAGVTLKDFADGRGPLFDTENGVNDGYTADVKDLFLYGDQFLNLVALGSTADVPQFALPSLDPDSKFMAAADVESLFADLTTPDVTMRCDGVVRLSVKTHLWDSSPQNVGRVVL